MQVLVLGSGVIGTTIAYYLAKDGHAVTVLDRQLAPGMETSYANAGEVSPGYSAPWAGPGVPLKAVKWLLMQHSPLVIRPMLDPAMWRWGLALLRNCTQARYELNKGRMVRLAEYSRDCLAQLRSETHIRYDERMLGTLQLFRSQKQLDGAGRDTEILEAHGVDYQLLDRDGCIRHEPALAAVRRKFVGGLRLPGDETGDCFKFTQRLARLAHAAGASFRFGVKIEGFARTDNGIAAVHTDAGPFEADRYVMALGSYSPRLAEQLGLQLPIYPVKGFSLTLPVTDARMAPESTVMDETYKVAVTRLGDRIRVGGTAQLSGYDMALDRRRRETLAHVVGDLFPRGTDLIGGEFWTGLRPMTPDGTPIVGRSGIRNLLLATGHGTLGWTMATGTGRVICDLVGGRKPEIDMEGLGLARYS